MQKTGNQFPFYDGDNNKEANVVFSLNLYLALCFALYYVLHDLSHFNC